MIILQTALLLHAVIHHLAAWRKRTTHSLKHSVMYIVMVILGLYYLLSELLRLVILPNTRYIQSPSFCWIAAYHPRILPHLFFLFYLLQILFRMEAIFSNS